MEYTKDYIILLKGRAGNFAKLNNEGKYDHRTIAEVGNTKQRQLKAMVDNGMNQSLKIS